MTAADIEHRLSMIPMGTGMLRGGGARGVISKCGPLHNVLRATLRKKAGFVAEAMPVIVDLPLGVNANKLAAALRARGGNARSVPEIFGTGKVADSDILNLTQRINRVVA